MEKSAVIIAADDAALRRHLHTLLPAQGCEVFEALDTADIPRFAQRQRPDFIILGPFGDGAWDVLHIAQRIRRADRRVPLILTAARSSEALAIVALRAGITHYFKSPLTCVAVTTTPFLPLHTPVTSTATPMPERPQDDAKSCEEQCSNRLISQEA